MASKYLIRPFVHEPYDYCKWCFRDYIDGLNGPLSCLGSCFSKGYCYDSELFIKTYPGKFCNFKQNYMRNWITCTNCYICNVYSVPISECKLHSVLFRIKDIHTNLLAREYSIYDKDVHRTGSSCDLRSTIHRESSIIDYPSEKYHKYETICDKCIVTMCSECSNEIFKIKQCSEHLIEINNIHKGIIDITKSTRPKSPYTIVCNKCKKSHTMQLTGKQNTAILIEEQNYDKLIKEYNDYDNLIKELKMKDEILSDANDNRIGELTKL